MMRWMVLGTVLFCAVPALAQEYFTLSDESGAFHIRIDDIKAMPELKFPEKPLPVSPEEAARKALASFSGRFPKAESPKVEKVTLCRFPEEYEKDRWYYVVSVKPVQPKAQERSGSWVDTRRYGVIVPFTDCTYSPALTVVEEK